MGDPNLTQVESAMIWCAEAPLREWLSVLKKKLMDGQVKPDDADQLKTLEQAIQSRWDQSHAKTYGKQVVGEFFDFNQELLSMFIEEMNLDISFDQMREDNNRRPPISENGRYGYIVFSGTESCKNSNIELNWTMKSRRSNDCGQVISDRVSTIQKFSQDYKLYGASQIRNIEGSNVQVWISYATEVVNCDQRGKRRRQDYMGVGEINPPCP